ncbi:hypothetical protein TrST_g1143 [Triparma strigata]|uniref:Uncharacterized protein n=1 Tax=Triparma strigata TaxID=1606541 RepID=A0A9W7A1R1_9STRA|nr:hypothetical protein TrST_g1143 [Triparma strigata]
MAVIINVDSDATKKFITVIGESIGSDTFITSNLSLLEDPASLLKSLLNSVPEIVTLTNADTVTSSITYLTHLITKLPLESQSPLIETLLKSLTTVGTTTASNNPLPILHSLISIHSLLPKSYLPLLTCLQFSRSSNLFHLLTPSLPSLSPLIPTFPVEQQRTLYLTIKESVTGLSQHSYSLKYLSTFPPTSSNLSSSNDVEIIKIIKESLNTPLKLFGNKGIYNHPIIYSISDSSLKTLLEIFKDGGIKEYSTWVTNGGIDGLNNLHPLIRIISLSDLGVGTFGYDVIKNKCDLEECSEVEEIIVSSIMEGVVEGCLDQEKKVFRCEKRVGRKGGGEGVEELKEEVERVRRGIERE